MAEASCIAHPPKQHELGRFSMLRADYMALCKDADLSQTAKACAAKILNIFENWTNSKLDAREQNRRKNKNAIANGEDTPEDEGLWVYESAEDIYAALMEEHPVKTIRQALNWIVEAGFVDRRRNPKHRWDKTYQYLFKIKVIQENINAIASNPLFSDVPCRELRSSLEATSIETVGNFDVLQGQLRSSPQDTAIPKIQDKDLSKESPKDSAQIQFVEKNVFIDSPTGKLASLSPADCSPLASLEENATESQLAVAVGYKGRDRSPGNTRDTDQRFLLVSQVNPPSPQSPPSPAHKDEGESTSPKSLLRRAMQLVGKDLAGYQCDAIWSYPELSSRAIVDLELLLEMSEVKDPAAALGAFLKKHLKEHYYEFVKGGEKQSAAKTKKSSTSIKVESQSELHPKSTKTQSASKSDGWLSYQEWMAKYGDVPQLGDMAQRGDEEAFVIQGYKRMDGKPTAVSKMPDEEIAAIASSGGTPHLVFIPECKFKKCS